MTSTSTTNPARGIIYMTDRLVDAGADAFGADSRQRRRPVAVGGVSAERASETATTRGGWGGRLRRVAAAAALLMALGLAAVAAPAGAGVGHPVLGSFDGTGSTPGAFAGVDRIAVSQAGGDVYVLDSGHQTIDKFDATGAAQAFTDPGLAGATSLSLVGIGGELDIAVDNSGTASNGNIYVISESQSVLYGFAASGAALSGFPISLPAGGDYCGAAVAPDGGIWVDNFLGNISEYDTTGIATGDSLGLGSTCHIAFDTAGNLYAAQYQGAVAKYNPDGAGSFAPDLTTPVVDASGGAQSVTANPGTGGVFVAHPDRIEEFDAGGASAGSSGHGTLTNARGVAADGASGQVFVSDASGTGLVYRFGTVTLPDVTTGTASNIVTTTATAHGVVNPAGVPVTGCHFEYVTDSAFQATGFTDLSSGGSVPCVETVGSGTSDTAVHADITGLTGATLYRFRLVAENADGATEGQDRTLQTVSPPLISDESVANVTATGADVKASINPGAGKTTYHFEYGPTSAYGQATSDEEIGGVAAISMKAHIAGLTPATKYHFRVVATNAVGTVAGPDRTFITHESSTPPFSLPDGRRWELVSPTDKTGGSGQVLAFPLEYRIAAASAGGAITYNGDAFFNAKDRQANQYVSKRASSGWETENASVYHGGPPVGWSEDASRLLLTSDNSDPAKYANLYLPTSGGALEPLIKSSPPNRTPSTFGYADYQHVVSKPAMLMGVSKDLSHVIFAANDALTPGAPDPGAGANNLYEWVDGELRLVNVLPDGTPAPGASFGFDYQEPGLGGAPNLSNAISDDGTRIFWTDQATGNLYVRKDGTTTVQIDASQGPGPGGGGRFLTASADGSKVLFTDGADAGLTDDTVPGSGANLYQFDVDSGQLIDLTPGPLVSVLGLMGASHDGSSVYFVATGALAAGAVAGEPNLYRYRNAATSWIATLSPQDNEVPISAGSATPADWDPVFRYRTARISPNGRYAAFVSRRPLTGVEQSDSSAEQLFLYDASSSTLSCASCHPDGSPSGYPIHLPRPLSGWYQQRYLLDDGSLFFDSREALSPQDVNGRPDVYEFKDGRSHLLSGGSGDPFFRFDNGFVDSNFADASADGKDVFFTTSDALVPQDADDIRDMYDARIGGGFPAAPSAGPCGAVDDCHGATGAPANLTTAASISFVGPGNAKTHGSTNTPRVKPLTRTVHGRRFTVRVRVPVAGALSVRGASIRTVVRRLSKRGTYGIALRLDRRAVAQLRRKDSLRLKLRLTFEPEVGKSSEASVALTVKR